MKSCLTGFVALCAILWASDVLWASDLPDLRTFLGPLLEVRRSKQYFPSNGFSKTILDYHNHFREHGKLAPLKWDRDLAEYAFRWTSYIGENQCKGGHSYPIYEGNNFCGENFFQSFDFPALQNDTEEYYARSAVDGWFNEIKYFQWAQNQPWGYCPQRADSRGHVGDIGHFTQVMWTKTEKMGCSINSCINEDNGFPTVSVVVSCNYFPCGNYMNQPVFNSTARWHLNKWDYIKDKFGGLPRCDEDE
jgi:hypothetical protein